MYPGQQWNQRGRPPAQNPNAHVVNAQQQPMAQQQQQIPQQQQQIAAQQQQYAAQQPQVQYVQQPPPQQGQYAQPQVQYVQQGQQPIQYQQPPQQQQQVVYGQPPQGQQVVYAQQPPQQQAQYGQQQPQQVQYGQQQPQQVQYGQQPPVQYVQQGQQPQVQYVQQQQQQPMYAQPQQAQGGVYGQPQIQKNAGPPPPSYGVHKVKKKNIYEQADEKLNVNDNNNWKAAQGQTWEQPKPDAKGTCPVVANFNQQTAIEMAKQLRKAMKGMGCDKNKVATVTGQCNAAQRVMIREAFRTIDQVMYGKGKERNLLRDLKSELGGSYEKLACACYEDLGEYDARLVLNALAGMGFNSELLIEVVCTRTNKQIEAMKSAWTTSLRKQKGMIQCVQDETKKMMSGNHFQSLMLTILQGKRPSNRKPDAQQVETDAETLNRFLKQEKKSDSKTKFVEIYTQRSWAHIGALSERFSDVSKKYNLEAAIKKTFGEGSDTSQALRVITKFCTSPYDFWAEKLRKSMKGMGTVDDLLIRIVVTRCEIDMSQIKNTFGQRYGNGKTLKNWIEDDVSGAYRRLLLKLCGYE